MKHTRTNFRIAILTAAALAALVPACSGSDVADVDSGDAVPVAAASTQLEFETPEEAVRVLLLAAEADDPAQGEAIFGADGIELLRSGDPVADDQAVALIRREAAERVTFEDREDGSKVAVFGHEGWPFPVPLVRGDSGWRFDVDAGWEEIENRRVGRNELSTLTTLREIVDAQREYAAVGRDGQPRTYARKLVSSEGRHDGLYWPVAEGETPSPLGPLLAAASAEGYRRSEEGPVPFHGYFYRLLTAQGPAAPGGAKDYADAQGRLTGGFALVAWPAKYGNSGVMTFLVNHRGVVFQRDLGEETAEAVKTITVYDPDGSWQPARDE